MRWPVGSRVRHRFDYRVPPELEFPTKLIISNQLHPSYTVIDLQTPDRLGLLYDVLKCLSEPGVNIAHSRIATEKGAAFDTFYVTDLTGAKILSQQRSAAIKRQLLEVLDPAPEKRTARTATLAAT